MVNALDTRCLTHHWLKIVSQKGGHFSIPVRCERRTEAAKTHGVLQVVVVFPLPLPPPPKKKKNVALEKGGFWGMLMDIRLPFLPSACHLSLAGSNARK